MKKKVHLYELYSRKLAGRVEYIKNMVQLGEWSEKAARQMAKLYFQEIMF